MTTCKEGKARRRNAPKVQTGCLTCKSRRVKCDESKPECERCKWGGRKCAGYGSVFRIGTSANFIKEDLRSSSSPEWEVVLTPASGIVSSPRPTIDPHGGLLPFERRALHHFLNRSAFEFSDSLASHFWQNYVPELSTKSDAVRHALIATSTLHEQVLSGATSLDDSFLALSHYQKAISAANARLDDRTSTSTVIEETLASCALFACIEALLDEYPRALTHLQGGLQMLWQLSTADPQSLSHESRHAGIFEIFTQYDSQALEYTGSLVSRSFLSEVARERSKVDWETLISHDIARGNYLEAVRKAAIWLRHIVREAQHYMRSCAKDWKYKDDIPLEVTKSQDHQLVILRTWYGQIFYKLLQIPKQLQRDSVRAAIAQITMLYHSTYLNLVACLSPNETTVYDGCMDSFEATVAAGEEMLSCANIANRKFTIESPLVEHVYFVGMKCRDRALRTRAIALLRRCRREGVWEGQPMAAVAEAAMEIEEAWTRDFMSLGLHPLSVDEVDLNTSNNGGYEAAFIPEECRIHSLSFEWDKKNRILNIFHVECSRCIGGNWLRESRVVRY